MQTEDKQEPHHCYNLLFAGNFAQHLISIASLQHAVGVCLHVPPTERSSFLLLTFSQPSIFSLFLSLLLRFESTLIREPRESVWFPVATAKEEKAGGGGASKTYSHVYLKHMQKTRKTHMADL